MTDPNPTELEVILLERRPDGFWSVELWIHAEQLVAGTRDTLDEALSAARGWELDLNRDAKDHFSDYLEISERARRALIMAGLQTVQEVKRAGPAAFLRIPGCGRVTVAEIERVVGGWVALEDAASGGRS